MNRLIVSVILGAVLPILIGCGGGATLVTRAAGGGRVQLHGASVPAYGEARVLMAEHCDGKFRTHARGGRTIGFACAAGRSLAAR